MPGQIERAGAEGVDLRVETGTDPGDLALAQVDDPEGADELFHPARADPADVRLLDDREERPLGPPPRFEQAREVRPVAELGDCLLYTSPSPRDRTRSRMPSS